ncbi:MAG TPA: acyltransferase family protein [Anaerolineales bacterium]|nr:acyltransferase family protein [Anaerolineales bacterium]
MAIRTFGPEGVHPHPAKPRLYYLDNIRTVLITGVVLGHLSVTYGVDADWTYYEGGEVNPIVSILQLLALAIAIGFALGLFFLIAGYFTAPAYDRRGFQRFLFDRVKRLGIPWLVFEVFINPLVHYAVDSHGGDCQGALYDCQYQGTFWQYLWEFPRLSASLGDGPVWFLEALLIFSFFYALWRRFIGESGSGKRYGVPDNVSIAWFSLLIGLTSFIVRFWARAFVQYEPLHLEFARFPQYITMFIAGTWAYRRGWLDAFPVRQAKMWNRITLLCVLVFPFLMISFGALSGDLDPRAFGGLNWMSLAYSVWEGFLVVSMAITVLDGFRRRFNHQGRLARLMSETSFAVYVLHPAVIVPLALLLSGIHMNLSLKFLLVSPVALALCYLLAYGLRKLPLGRSVLG